MCGIAGVFNSKGIPCSEETLSAMQAALTHRGPDDSGIFRDGPMGFSFRRLSILDLEHGHQPMSTPDGRFTIVFNGEIYNYPKLRKELESGGYHFLTHSDTETLLAGFSKEGSDFFRRLNGMFACAIWDRKKKVLTLARDPLGIKPLYISWNHDSFYFASELKTLLAAGIDSALLPSAVLDYLAYGYTHAPDTVIAGIKKFPAGHWMEFALDRPEKTTRYWKLPTLQSPAHPMSEAQAQEELEELLFQAIHDQMISDVPVGVFLSGGIDSSIVTALMAKASAHPIRSYSIGFDGGDSVDETHYAETVAQFLSTKHTTIRLPSNILDEMPRMIDCLDEPIADAAILPTWYLSTKARESVKVVLTGEGGDEIFAGYGRHKAAYVTEFIEKIPAWLRPMAIPIAQKMGSGAYFKAVPLEGAKSWAAAEAGLRLNAARQILTSEAGVENREWIKPFLTTKGLNGLLAFDLQTSMADQLLMKVDKTTMRASLEARVPLLDLRLVDFMFRLPSSLKIRHFRGKYLLRKVAAKMLPREIVTRRKHGFILRVQKWMRSSENSLLPDAFNDGVLSDTGFFQKDVLLRDLKDLKNGSPSVNVDVYFRTMILSLWLRALKSARK